MNNKESAALHKTHYPSVKNLLLFFCVFISLKSYAQSDTISRAQLIGNWNAYMIMDTTAYFATPDSLKIADSLGIDILHFKMITYHFLDNGTAYATSEYMDDSLKTTWTLNGDTMVSVQNDRERENDTTIVKLVMISGNRVQFCSRERIGKKTYTHYVFMEKVE